MIPTLIRRNAAAATKAAFDIKNNPYKAKRTWPPDFTQLSQKHQFRMERRYRRRAKLKWARPQWTKFVKLAQWGSILCKALYAVVRQGSRLIRAVVVLGYGIFFMEVPVGEEGASPTPFDGVR